MTQKNPQTELERRHHAIDQKIAKEQLHPSADGLKLTELKRLKLKLKDELMRLKSVSPSELH